MKIFIKLHEKQALPEIISKGDFIDLRYCGEPVRMKHGDFKVLSLGVAMKLPKGYEAIVVSRSSTYKNFSIFNPGGFGVIDNTYNGNMDEWKYPAYCLGERACIMPGDRICQFRIQLSQKATIWQKIKWLFSNKIEFKHVDSLSEISRGGLGSTGKC